MTVLLAAATFLSWLFHRVRPSGETRKTLSRVRTWWLIVVCLFAALSVGCFGIAGLFCLVSLLALQEFVTLDSGMPRRGTVRTILALGTVTVYALTLLPSLLPHTWLIGLFLIFMLGLGLVAAIGSMHRGLTSCAAFLACTCGLVCVLALSQIGTRQADTNAGIRLVFLLLLLTGLNDVAQYVWGKGLGRRLVVPRISPGKTWAGLLGGVSTTAILAAALAPSLLARSWQRGLLAGLLIGFGGFAGDILASAYKRHVGAGESGRLLPGHGGIIDRIDSLCMTAPLLYCAVQFF